jgi:hypothetical protein
VSDIFIPGTASAGTELEFPTLNAFVEFLGTVYARQVADQHDSVWCPEWWRHLEAYLRLQSLHRAFEYLRRDATTGLSAWWIDHADKHMAKLFDPRGPFKYCGVRNGHKNMLPELPIEGQVRPTLPPGIAELADDGIEMLRQFSTLDEFVNQWLSRCYARQVRDVNDTVWCPTWWEHPEAAHRLTALWRAYEHLRRDAGVGLSQWWLLHADQHMTKLFDPRGTFKYCSVRNGHKHGMVPPLRGTDMAPPHLFVDPSRETLEDQRDRNRALFRGGHRSR